MKSIQYKVEYLLFQSLLLVVKLIPMSILTKIGTVLGNLLYFSGIRRKVVEKNLEIAFGNELDNSQRKRLCKRVYIHISNVLLEFLSLFFIPEEKLSAYVSIENLHLLDEAVNENRGVILAGNHFGTWELLSAAISTFGNPVHIYTGAQKNHLFDNKINQLRERFGVIPIRKSKIAAFEMLKVLKKGGILGMAGDLNVSRDSLFVNFFGKRAAVGQGLPAYALKRGSPLLFAWSVRVAPMKHRGYIIRIPYSTTGNHKKDIESIAQRISNELERVIRDHPDQYFWINRRWKTRPREEKTTHVY